MNQKLVYIFLFGLCSLNIYAQKKKPVSSAVQKQQLVKEQLPSYKRKYFVNNDGFEWYKTKSDGKFGAEDRNNKVIIPCVYDHVKLHRGNSTDWSWPCFEVKKDNYVGVYSTTGDIIISVDKGYYAIEACSDETWVVRQSWNKEKMAHFFFRKDNGCGVCDISGKELCFFEGCDAVIPSYFEGKYYYRLKRNSKCGVADGNGKIIIPISSDWLSFDYNYNFVDSDNKVVGNLSNIETRNNPLERAIEEASCKYLYECTATPIELDNLKYYKT